MLVGGGGGSMSALPRGLAWEPARRVVPWPDDARAWPAAVSARFIQWLIHTALEMCKGKRCNKQFYR